MSSSNSPPSNLIKPRTSSSNLTNLEASPNLEDQTIGATLKTSRPFVLVLAYCLSSLIVRVAFCLANQPFCSRMSLLFSQAYCLVREDGYIRKHECDGKLIDPVLLSLPRYFSNFNIHPLILSDLRAISIDLHFGYVPIRPRSSSLFSTLTSSVGHNSSIEIAL